MADLLEVRCGSLLVGDLRVVDDRFVFTYDPAWLREARFPVSRSLPVTTPVVIGGAAQTFFTNLLPEGNVRAAVCARLGISVDNDFALLQAIGGECAGALSLVPGAATKVERGDYEELSKRQLRALVDDGPVALLVGGESTRLSLAGAQDKVPAALRNGKLHLGRNGAPSTHILKLPNATYAHLPANEAFCLGLARAIGFDVVDAELFTKTEPASLLVTRYDRLVAADLTTTRLHQEDLCQALGLPSTRKYETEGGPSFVQVVTTIRDVASRPLVEVPRLIEWQAFNLVVGNSDGHAKNLSLLYAGAATTVSPFYDLISTRHYKRLDRKLAMRVGDRANPDEVNLAQWQQLSEELGIGPRVVLRLVADLAQRTLDELAAWKREFRQRYGEQSILQELPTAIASRARRVLRSFTSSS